MLPGESELLDEDAGLSERLELDAFPSEQPLDATPRAAPALPLSLCDDCRSMSETRVEGAPSKATTARSTVLRPRRLVGRDSELRDVLDSLASAPVTTLVGPGGVGKTALAINVAAASTKDFPDGVTVVWLASVRSAELVAAEVAVQLGLSRLGGQSYEDALTAWLTERDVLLVIDNCEHVVSAVADLVDTLTQRLARLRVLATSREPLWIDGEVTYRLAPLAASAAVELFRERAGTRARDVDTERAGEICRRVDGLPLAIELAAARVAGLDLEDVARHLDDLFNLLPRSARRADGVLRSLRATVEWSDALLDEHERRLLHRMAVFAGPFELTAVKEVCAAEGQTAAQIADLTARLVEKSLLDGVLARHARFYQRIALQAAVGPCLGRSGRTSRCSVTSGSTCASRSRRSSGSIRAAPSSS
jgi:predicted ATPase